MDAVKFLEEWKRMCCSCKDYDECSADSVVCRYIAEVDSEIVEIVKQWSTAHPRKTRLQDFLEKFPDAKLDKDGIPDSCCESLGYCDSCKISMIYSCSDCWNEPV